VDEKKTLQRYVVILYHHMKHSITVKPIHRTYWRVSCVPRNKHTRFIHRITKLVFV